METVGWRIGSFAGRFGGPRRPMHTLRQQQGDGTGHHGYGSGAPFPGEGAAPRSAGGHLLHGSKHGAASGWCRERADSCASGVLLRSGSSCSGSHRSVATRARRADGGSQQHSASSDQCQRCQSPRGSCSSASATGGSDARSATTTPCRSAGAPRCSAASGGPIGNWQAGRTDVASFTTDATGTGTGATASRNHTRGGRINSWRSCSRKSTSGGEACSPSGSLRLASTRSDPAALPHRAAGR
jgi:hypothetical protein